MKHSLGLQLCRLHKCAGLTEVVRQNDKLFIDLIKALIKLLKFLCSKLIETFSVKKENAVKI